MYSILGLIGTTLQSASAFLVFVPRFLENQISLSYIIIVCSYFPSVAKLSAQESAWRALTMVSLLIVHADSCYDTVVRHNRHIYIVQWNTIHILNQIKS